MKGHSTTLPATMWPVVVLAVGTAAVACWLGAQVSGISFAASSTTDWSTFCIAGIAAALLGLAVRRTLRQRSTIPESIQGDDWNALIDVDRQSATLDSVDDRLCRALSKLGDNRWQQLFQSMPDGLCVTTADGTITEANRAAGTLLVQNPDAALCNEYLQVVLERAEFTGVEVIRDRVNRGLSSFVCEIQRSEHVEAGVLLIRCSPLLDCHDKVEGLIWSIRDVTQQKLAEAVRDQFVSTATHELRTPLANLKAYAETLAVEDGIDVERQKGFCNVIQTEATRLARFVDDLLNISEMEGGALRLTPHEVDVERMVNDVVANLRPQIDHKKQVFELIMPAKMPRVQADKDKLSASLTNLLGNACKYTGQGGRVGLVVEIDQGMLQFHVEDTGVGIRDEEVTRIFDKFFRSEDRRVRKENGTGLGLTFAKEVATLHGGMLSVHSEVNKGSRFTFAIPL